MEYRDIVEGVRNGKNARKLVEDAAGPIGQDRVDDIQDEQSAAAAFEMKAREIAGSVPYIPGPDWINVYAEQLRQGADLEELKILAYKNRQQYAGSARIDSGGDFATWDAVHQALLAVPTDQVGPSVPEMA